VRSNPPWHRRRRDGCSKCAMKILIAHEFVLVWRMMFGKIVGTVGSPGGPVEV
jgi:hypothetical protein